MSKVVPFSLKDAPFLIEAVFPAQKISVEAQKERKANLGQTLTGLGSYWKGRKPLILVRACVLASLLPSTGNQARDIEIFEYLIGASEKQIGARIKDVLSIDDILKYGTETQIRNLIEFDDDETPRFRRIPKNLRLKHSVAILERMPYQARIEYLLRPEEVDETVLTEPLVGEINKYLGTDASNLYDLVKQLGVMRFGHTPVVGDTFAGGGSIPFEAARIGCDVYASDLNPIACMLTWGALNIIGSDDARREKIVSEQQNIAEEVDAEIIKLGIEFDDAGNRAKAYLYCLETRCPKTGWLVPMSPTWLISKAQKVVGILEPDYINKRFDIRIKSNATDSETKRYSKGTIQDGNLVYELDGETYSTSIKAIRGDRRLADGTSTNDLRKWERTDFVPRPGDIFQERLYCVQWMKRETLDRKNPETFFAPVTREDLNREKIVEDLVRGSIVPWQDAGLMPDMAIEMGDETTRLLRERGWTYWHHLFNARQLLLYSMYFAHHTAEEYIFSAKTLDWNSRLSNWMNHWDKTNNVFYNQALNPLYNYGVRCFKSHEAGRSFGFAKETVRGKILSIRSANASDIADSCDIFITDPPYADAVNYHEITEFFIAWLRKNPPKEFANWIWDSRRLLAIKGDGEDFRKGMIDAYSAMANHMPDNGLQIVMFTHQSTSVWADMAQIFWGSGLRVMAAWYIATETTSELKKGGYVQGTVILVLRKRLGNESGYKDEIVQEVKSEVAEQIDTMVGLNQTLKGSGRIENLFEDADLQMAGYAAALRVLTRYTKIDGTDMTKEALRPRVRGERSLVNEIVEYAVQVANEHMVPEGISTRLWEGLSGSERFYLKMVDIESVGLKKLDNYQNFAKAFRVDDFQVLMGKMEANNAHLKSAKDFKRSVFEGSEFATSTLRALLYAIYRIGEEVDGDQVQSELRELIPTYMTRRDDLMEMAGYLSKQWLAVNEGEARSAEIVRGLIKNERFG